MRHKSKVKQSINFILTFIVLFLIGLVLLPLFKENFYPETEENLQPVTFVENKNNFPITIAADNYTDDLKDLGPFIIYAWAADPAISGYNTQINALAKEGPFTTKMVLFSSYATMEQKLSAAGHADFLKQMGVEWMGYNTEGDKTPSNEFSNLTVVNEQSNSVCKFAQIAQRHGFKSLWGAIRATTGRAVRNESLVQLYDRCGLDGVAFQEQKFIENTCAQDRYDEVLRDKSGMDTNTGKDLYLTVQIMESRCLQLQQCNNTSKYQNCMDFTKRLFENRLADDIAIWINQGEAVDRATRRNTTTFLNFVKEIRNINVGTSNQPPTPTPTPPIQIEKPQILFNANPTTITRGANSALTWGVINALPCDPRTDCDIRRSSVNTAPATCTKSGGWSGNAGISGRETVSPTSTTTYSLTCTNSVGSSTASVTVTVNNNSTPTPSPTPPAVDAPNITLSVSPVATQAGATSTIHWSVTGTTPTCVKSDGWNGSAPISGSESIIATVTKTYTLTCTNSAGSHSKSITITIGPLLPATVTPTPSPTPIINGTICGPGSTYSSIDYNKDNRVSILDFICFVEEYRRHR